MDQRCAHLDPNRWRIGDVAWRHERNPGPHLGLDRVVARCNAAPYEAMVGCAIAVADRYAVDEVLHRRDVTGQGSGDARFERDVGRAMGVDHGAIGRLADADLQRLRQRDRHRQQPQQQRRQQDECALRMPGAVAAARSRRSLLAVVMAGRPDRRCAAGCCVAWCGPQYRGVDHAGDGRRGARSVPADRCRRCRCARDGNAEGWSDLRRGPFIAAGDWAGSGPPLQQ